MRSVVMEPSFVCSSGKALKDTKSQEASIGRGRFWRLFGVQPAQYVDMFLYILMRNVSEIQTGELAKKN